jgi:hypothetical protein
MRLIRLLVAARLFAAAGSGTTAIDNAGNVWLTGSTNFILTTATAFEKTETSQLCAVQNLRLSYRPPSSIASTLT